MNFLVPGAPGAFPWILTALTADVARQINSVAFKKHLKNPELHNCYNCFFLVAVKFGSSYSSWQNPNC